MRYRVRRLVVLDVPLLFERGGAERCDLIAVVSASAGIQRARVLARAGMTPEKFDAILARQIPDIEKRERADIVIETGGSIIATWRDVRAIVGCLGSRSR